MYNVYIYYLHFQNKLSHYLKELLDKIGYDETNEDSEHINCLRQEAAKCACVLDNTECKRTANLKLELYYENPVKNG